MKLYSISLLSTPNISIQCIKLFCFSRAMVHTVAVVTMVIQISDHQISSVPEEDLESEAEEGPVNHTKTVNPNVRSRIAICLRVIMLLTTHPCLNLFLYPGNALIIQESNKSCPDDSATGGSIIFDFIFGAYIESAVIPDIDENNTPMIMLTFEDGTTEMINTVATGNNGVLDLNIDRENVIQFKITFKGSGAINSLNYVLCPDQPTPAPVVRPTMKPTPRPTMKPTPRPTPKVRKFPYHLPSSLPSLSRKYIHTPSFSHPVSFSQRPSRLPSRLCARPGSLLLSRHPSLLPSRHPSLLPSRHPSLLRARPASLLPNRHPSQPLAQLQVQPNGRCSRSTTYLLFLEFAESLTNLLLHHPCSPYIALDFCDDLVSLSYLFCSSGLFDKWGSSC